MILTSKSVLSSQGRREVRASKLAARERKNFDMSPPITTPSIRLVPFFDAHCHLQDRRLSQWELEGEEDEGEEGGEAEEEKRHHRRLDAIVARARAANVVAVACCACSERDWKDVAALADRFPGFVHPSFGLHPWFLGERKPGWERRLEALLRSRPEAGVGESGLDKAKTHSSKKRPQLMPPLDVQMECLRQHVRIAKELRRPLTVHCVKAAGTLYDALWPFAPFMRRAAAGPDSPSESPSAALSNTCVVFHGWQGPKGEVLRLSRLGDGVFFSLGARSLPPAPLKPATTTAEEEEAQESSPLSHIPLSQLLIETDSPDGFEPRRLGEGIAVASGVEEEGVDGKEKTRSSSSSPSLISTISSDSKQGLAAPETSRKANWGESSLHSNAELNQPANVAALLPELARALGRDESDVARACWENARAVFCCAPSGGERGGE